MHIRDMFTKQCFLSVTGIILVAFGCALIIFWMDIFEAMLAKEMKLAPNTKTYEIWKTPPLSMSIDIYLYNWTNPSSFDEGAFPKPILKEIGPYRFTEKMDKSDIIWNLHNSTISYLKSSTFYFDPDGSVGDLNDMITTVNPVAVSAAYNAMNWNYLKQKEVSIGLAVFNEETHVTKTASELLFEGYNDDMLDMALEMQKIDSKKADFNIPADRFGWFYTKNGTTTLNGHFNVHTGDENISQIGQVKRWNYTAQTNVFPNRCGKVMGSAGEFFPPKQTKDKPIYLFAPELCRTIELEFESEINVYGVTGYKYVAGRKTVDNGTLYPEQKCFESKNKTIPSGVFDISTCQYGLPGYLSFPHFYAADPYYLQFFDGLALPSKETHQFYIILEPMTGIILEVAARLQINLLIEPVSNIALFQYAPRMFFPAFWMEQKVTVTKEMASEISGAVIVPTIGYICLSIIICIGLIMIFWLPITRLVCHKFCPERAYDIKIALAEPTINSTTSFTMIEKGDKVPEHSPLLTDSARKPNVLFTKNTNNEGNVKLARIHETESGAENVTTSTVPLATSATTATIATTAAPLAETEPDL